MSRNQRKGLRKTRDQTRVRKPKLKYYLVFTDTDETEKNYLEGLRNEIPRDLRRNLVIKIMPKERTEDLVNKCLSVLSKDSQFREPWIVLDYDNRPNFDQIVESAEINGIFVAWSNPCIEAWFLAYFGTIPANQDSQKCCKHFCKVFKEKTNLGYNRCKKFTESDYKNDKEIYIKLKKFGDEENAFKIIDNKRKEHKRNEINKPSEQSPCTQIDLLVKEIRRRIDSV
ncbi:MAG TPA: RloB family protein [Caldisericia bacterium]|nr:RloB family protein [Caldisericia bacterium]